VLNDYDLHAAELELLRCALVSLDRADEAAEVIARDGVTVLDRYGTPKSHPAADIEARSRAAYARMVAQLSVKLVEDEPKAPHPRSVWALGLMKRLFGGGPTAVTTPGATEAYLPQLPVLGLGWRSLQPVDFSNYSIDSARYPAGAQLEVLVDVSGWQLPVEVGQPWGYCVQVIRAPDAAVDSEVCETRNTELIATAPQYGAALKSKSLLLSMPLPVGENRFALRLRPADGFVDCPAGTGAFEECNVLGYTPWVRLRW
jgi:hypothetical protein